MKPPLPVLRDAELEPLLMVPRLSVMVPTVSVKVCRLTVPPLLTVRSPDNSAFAIAQRSSPLLTVVLPV